MAGREEEARSSTESLSRPIIGGQVPYGDPAAPAYGYANTPSYNPYSSIEDERPVPKWPYVAGAALLLVIPIVVIIAILII